MKENLYDRVRDVFTGGRDTWELTGDEDGVGTIELVLILVVLIGLVVIFKDSITSLLNSIFVKINTNANNL